MKYLKILNKENIIVLVLTIYIFFWDMFLTLGVKFDIRLIIFILSFFLIKEIIIDFKKNDYTFFYLIFVIAIFITSHSFLVSNIFNMKLVLSIFFLLYIFGITYYFGHIILTNKNKIIYLFICLFLISIFFHYMIGFTSNPEPFSCGGLKNFFRAKNDYDEPIFLIHFISSYSLIYNENSHLAMSTVGVIMYLIYLISNRNEKNISIFIITLFIIVVFLKSSGTLLAGTLFSIIAIFIFEYKRLNKFCILSFITLLIIFFIILVSDRVCTNKISLNKNDKQQFENFNPLSKKNKIENFFIEIEEFIDDKELDSDLKKKLIKKLDIFISDPSLTPELRLKLNASRNLLISLNLNNDNLNSSENNYHTEKSQLKVQINKSKKLKIINTQGVHVGSLSSDVFFHALKVTYDSIFIKPFGWGFQGYEFAFNHYNNTHDIFRKSLKIFNNKDASNNTFKIITEFGILSLIIFLFLLFCSLSKKISLENKIFLLPFLITQFIRGVGYFNGAFILIFFLLIMLQFKNTDKDNI